MKIKLIIYGEPIPRQAPLVLRSGIAVHKKKEVNKKNEIKLLAKKQLPIGFKIISEPLVILSLNFIFTPLKSLKKWQKDILDDGGELIKSTKPDLDNLEKLLYDALEGVVYENDSLIYQKSNIRKAYGLKPRIEIELEALENS